MSSTSNADDVNDSDKTTDQPKKGLGRNINGPCEFPDSIRHKRVQDPF